jgi:hypothetical protein
MTLPVSPHNPILSGQIELFTGTLTVGTGMRELQSFSVNILSPTATENYVQWSQVTVNGEVKVELEVLDSTFTTATTPAYVSWIALGK